MGVKIHKGFTIIELILFLGITGLVMGVLLVGVGSSLTRERYRDAVTSFQDYMQGQYNLVANVSNLRDASDICQNGKILSNPTPDTGRGTSDCTIVGRIVSSTQNGDQVTSSQVYATADVASLSGTDDIQVLNSAKLIASPTAAPYNLGWSATLVDPRPDDSLSTFSILIVRMPTTGLIHTYALKQANQSPAALVGAQIPKEGMTICVSNAQFIANGTGRSGIILQRDAVNSSGVVPATEEQC